MNHIVLVGIYVILFFIFVVIIPLISKIGCCNKTREKDNYIELV
jgi:hypothetical protein